MHVLLLADGRQRSEIVGAGLRDAGLTVDESRPSEDVDRLVSGSECDCVVLAHPPATSLAVIKRSQLLGRDLPALVVADEMDKSHRMAALEAGVDYILGPFTPDEISIRVSLMCRRWEVEQSLGASGTAASHGASDQVSSSSRRLRRQEEKRARLMDACVQLMGEMGYHRTTIKRLCAASGTCRRDIYELFGGKDAFFLWTFRVKGGELLARACSAFADAEGSWEARVRSALECAIDEMAARPVVARFLAEILCSGGIGVNALVGLIRNVQHSFVPAELQLSETLAEKDRVEIEAIAGAILLPIASAAFEGEIEALRSSSESLAHALALIVFDGSPPP